VSLDPVPPATLRFVQVDVFAEQPFGGNQLAVFFDAAALTPEQRQTIAAEMNYAESTFVEPSTLPDADARVRIHTPTRELPFAGHPTLGTAYALVWAGSTPKASFRLELGVGPLTVVVEPRGTRAALAWMEQPLPRFEPAPTAGLGTLVGLSDDEVTVPGLPAEYGSAGIPFLYLPVRSLDAVRRARPDAMAMAARLGGRDHPAVLVFTRETESADATVHARMFAPLMGVAEDAATGSAAGPLGAYLVRHGAVPVEPMTRIVVEQGLEMGRPSRLTAEVGVADGEVRAVRVGGGVRLVAEGTLYIG
jgi:trans-2,3-dihydro-3-hydroxyanthranilate isomerase